jgi:hypothetical protein
MQQSACRTAAVYNTTAKLSSVLLGTGAYTAVACANGKHPNVQSVVYNEAVARSASIAVCVSRSACRH